MPQYWDINGNLVEAPPAKQPQRWDVNGKPVVQQEAAPQEQPNPIQRAAQTQMDWALRTGKGALGALGGMAMSATPTSLPQAAAFLAAGPAGVITAKSAEAQMEEFRKAREAASQGRTSEALGYSATAGIPVAGPVISHIGEAIGQGKVPELIGEGAILAATGLKGEKYIKGEPIRDLARTIRLDTKAKSTVLKIFNPPAKDARFEQSLSKAVPEIAEQARQSGGSPKNPVPTVMDFLGLLRLAKKRLWVAREKYIAPHRPAITVSGDTLANAVEKGATKLLKEDNPAGYEALKAKAQSYRFEADGKTPKVYDLHSAEMLLKDINLELHKYYQKGPLEQLTISEATEVARLRRMGEALRKEIYSKVDAVAGPGVAELMKRYGALSDMELYADPLVRTLQRYGGKNLAEMSMETLFDTAAGNIYSHSGAIVRGARGIRRMLQKSPDQQLAGAFKQLGRYRPYTPTPTGGPPQPGPMSGTWSPTQKALPPGGTPITKPTWARYWEPPPANIPGQAPPPRESFVRGFQAPWGAVESQAYPALRKMLPSQAGPIDVPITPTPRFAPTTPQEVFKTQISPNPLAPKQLPAGPPAPYPQPPLPPSRGMQFEGAFPLEGQLFPEPIPRTSPLSYASGYVSTPESSYVKGFSGSWEQPPDFSALRALFEKGRRNK